MNLTTKGVPEVDRTPTLILLFISISLGALASIGYWFYVSGDLIWQVLYLDDALVLNKGGLFYIGGFAVAALLVDGGAVLFLRKAIAGNLRKIVTKVMWVSFLSAIILPQLVALAIASYADGKGLSICERASHHWLVNQVLVYTVSDATCLKMPAKGASPHIPRIKKAGHLSLI